MWELFLSIAIVFVLLEIFVPSLFFINFALSGVACAIISLFTNSIPILTISFVIFGFIFLFTIRPVFLKLKAQNTQKTGMEEKYIGQVATAIEDIDNNKGAIGIYDERWEARCAQPVQKGEKVTIKSAQGLVFYVEKSN